MFFHHPCHWLRSVRVVWAAALLLLMASSGHARLLVVLSDQSAAYEEVVEELRNKMTTAGDGQIGIDVRTAQNLESADVSVLADPDLIVTVGLAAAQVVVARERALTTPPLTLCLLIQRDSFEQLLSAGENHVDVRRISAVFIDQPVSRQFDLIRIALPDRSRVGVILGPRSMLLKNELLEQASEHGLTLNWTDVTEAKDLNRAFQKILCLHTVRLSSEIINCSALESDVVFALPDPVAFNSSTAYWVLLRTYRARVPVVGFSESLVKGGALLGLFSTVRQQAKQGAEIANRILAGERELPAPQYPRYFTVRVNPSVAHSLGIQIEEEATLETALNRQRRGGG
jgi:ABC-type uncharacterized transport system substrate-binding protein